MCLLTKQKEPLTAKEDITCYKVLIKQYKQYYAFYKSSFEYKFNQTYRLRKSLKNNKHPLRHGGSVTEGFHSYTSMYNSLYHRLFRGQTKQKGDADLVLVECTIPKGAKYFVGEHSNYEGDPGFTSTSIRINKIIARI